MEDRGVVCAGQIYYVRVTPPVNPKNKKNPPVSLMTTPAEKGTLHWQKQYYAIDVFFFKKFVTKNHVTPTDTVRYMFLRLGLACI